MFAITPHHWSYSKIIESDFSRIRQLSKARLKQTCGTCHNSSRQFFLSVLDLAKLYQLSHAASFMAADIRYSSRSSSDPRGQGVLVRSHGEDIFVALISLCCPQLLCGGIMVPCAEEKERHVKTRKQLQRKI